MFMLLGTGSILAMGPSQPSALQALVVLSPRVKWLGHEAYNSPLSSAKVKNVWRYTSNPPILLYGVVLN